MSHSADEERARALEATGNYRVLRRFVPARSYAPADHPVEDKALRRGLILDVETTGLDSGRDQIIELGMLPFDYSARYGTVMAVHEPLSYFEDPGQPLRPEIIELTGITDAMLAGQRIPDEPVKDCLASASLIIAHNAPFDRPFMERRFAQARESSWACSQREVPWKAYGLRSLSLEMLLLQKCRLFFEGHRATVDCQALLHLLATPFGDGSLPLQHLLRSARQPQLRLWATDAPFDRKDLLKERGYRWNNGERGGVKAWYRDLGPEEEAEETAWLSAQIYGRPEGWLLEKQSARDRYRRS